MKKYFGGLLVVGLFAVVSCGGSDSGGQSGATGKKLCENVLSKLRSCNLVRGGDGECSDSSFSDSVDECQAQCFAKAKCSTLEVLICDTSGMIDENDKSLACSFNCIRNAEMFTCDDGATTYISSDKCDTFPDCEDGSDEEGCPTFMCDDGSRLPADFECDGDTDCLGGEDEEGCSGTNTGSGVPGTLNCPG